MFRLHDTDPSRALEAAYRRIQHERMADVPMLNAALEVEAIDFSRQRGHWLGIVITPWFMNLVIVPGTAEGWVHVANDERFFRHFPAGSYAFLGNDEPEVGEFQSSSLISAMSVFGDQHSARQTARAALTLLMQAADEKGSATRSPAVATELPAPSIKLRERAMSKREFLLGRLARS